MIIWVIECIESEDVKVGLLLSWLLLSLFFMLNTYVCIASITVTVMILLLLFLILLLVITDYISWLLLF